MEPGSALGADCLPLLEDGTKHPVHQRGKNRVKARAGRIPGQGGCLEHSRDFEGSALAYSCPAFLTTSTFAGASLDVIITTMKKHSSLCGYIHHSIL